RQLLIALDQTLGFARHHLGGYFHLQLALAVIFSLGWAHITSGSTTSNIREAQGAVKPARGLARAVGNGISPDTITKGVAPRHPLHDRDGGPLGAPPVRSLFLLTFATAKNSISQAVP